MVARGSKKRLKKKLKNTFPLKLVRKRKSKTQKTFTLTQFVAQQSKQIKRSHIDSFNRVKLKQFNFN